jgi:hypothetical protein
MKKYLFILVLIFTSIFCPAQTEEGMKFVEDGKAWICNSYQALNGDDLYFYFDGDTIINGHQAKKMYVQDEGIIRYGYALYEEDRRVYGIIHGSDTSDLIYDFSLENPGDKTTINYSTYELQYTDYVTVHGKQFRRLHLSRSPYNEQVVWIEGIGGYNIRYRYGYTTSNEKLLGCLLNGKEIFSYKDFSKDKDDVNDYPQMLEQGKSWTYKNIDYSNPDNCYEYRYFIDGDTLIGGINRAKLYCENADNKHRVEYKDALYEAGKTVFWYHQKDHKDYIIYSFNENDLHSSNYDIGWSNYKKSSRETVTTNGETREVIYFKPYGSDEIVGCWAEGIGSSVDLVHSKKFQARKYQQLVRCELNGKELFGYEDFGLPEIVVVPEGERLPYHPMLKEGKTWLYKYHHYEYKYNEDNMISGYDEHLTDYNFVLRGDTVINGEQAFKMYRESESGSSVYFAAWIEQDKRVYRILEGETEKTLYYDFNLKRDWLWNDNASGTMVMVLHHVDSLTVNERMFNLYHFFSYYYEGESFNWIEGIGDYYEGILENGLSERLTCICDYLSFEKCFEDGVQIYPQVNIPDAISSIPSTRKDDETIYDLQGRIVTTPQKNRLYIKNGKKFVAR